MRSTEACENGEWSIATWRKDGGGDPKVMPFKCRSWRHEGECRAACGACDFARVAQALSEHHCWTYLVLTYPARKWPDVKELFRFGVIHWSRLRKRLVREYGNILYIQTWEVHKSGYPHVNVVISNAKLHAECLKDHFAVKKSFIDVAAQEVGFGYAKWLEPLRDTEAMAGYITKLGLELTGAHHKDQVPINAPRHFRRIRASRGLLPKRLKDETLTGQLFKISYDCLNEQMNGKRVNAGEPVSLDNAGEGV